MNWQLKRVKTSELKEYPQNPRTLTKKGLSDLKKSISKFGLAEPLVVNTDLTICGGHGRLKVLQDLKIENVDCYLPERELTEQEFKELNIRLNKNIAGEFDFDLLANFFEVDNLKEWGFKEDELDMSLFTDHDKLDEVPEVKTEAISQTGDLFLLDNRHRVLCGDSTKKEDVEKLMNLKVANLIFTSPPYNMANSNLYANYKDNLNRDDYINLNLNVVKNFVKYLKGFCLWNISYNKNSGSSFIEIMYQILKTTGLNFLELIVWNKKKAMPTRGGSLIRTYENILFTADETTVREDIQYLILANGSEIIMNNKNKKKISNYWEITTNNKYQIKQNKACYPVLLPLKGIMLTTNDSDLVVDPFLGSGTTLIAAEQLNRICYGMEIDPIYIDVILKRYHNLFPNKEIKCLNRKFDFQKLFS